jgi:threonine dehydrogenase-like Zn-dependent dehydrogenase
MCVRKRGRHVQVGLTSGAEKGEVALPIDIIVLKEVQILGSLGMQAPHFGSMLAMVEAGRLNPGKLVHRKIKLEEASSVLESMDKYGTLGVTVIAQY